MINRKALVYCLILSFITSSFSMPVIASSGHVEVLSTELIQANVGPMINQEAILSLALGESRTLTKTITKSSTSTITNEYGVSVDASYTVQTLFTMKSAINYKTVQTQSDTVTYTLDDKTTYTFPSEFAALGHNSCTIYAAIDYNLYKVVLKYRREPEFVVYSKVPVLKKFAISENITLPY